MVSNSEEVEICVNGKSVGRKKMKIDGYLEWENILYEPGQISAKGYRNGLVVKEEVVKTTDAPAQVVLSVDFKENCLAVIKAEVQDKNGLPVPDAGNELTFVIEGKARLLGTSNGYPSDHTSAYSEVRRVFNGLAQAIIEFNDGITVTAKAEGLACNMLQII